MLRKPAVLGLALLVAGCGVFSREAPSEDIDKAAALFFMRLKEAKYDEIYRDSSKHFQEQNTSLTVSENLQQINTMGRVMEHRRLSMTFDKEGENRVALPVYAVIFDHTWAEITLKFVDTKGEWKLLGFAVKPKSH